MKSRSYCLIGNIFEPPLLLLDETRELAIGRDAGAEIFLPARQVSRRHAKISWSTEDQGFVIRDLWSRRGFLVNGKPAERRLLRDDDDIVIEPYHLRFRVYEGDLGVLLARSAGPAPEGWRLAGAARGAELLDLIAHVDLADLSVVVEIDGESQSGKLTIEGGQVLAAEAGYLRGSRAAHALLMGDSCQFRMRAAQAQPASGQPPIPITQLLSEILARMGSDFVTTLDSAGIQESEVLQLEKRLRAAEAEKRLRALAQKGRMLEDDLARAEELQRALSRPLPRDARVGFERFARPAGAIAACVSSVTQLGASLFRVLLAEPDGAAGIDGLLRSMVIKTEYDLADSADLRGGDVLSLLRRRLAQRPERIPFTASSLDIALDRADGRSVSYSSDGALRVLHCHEGAVLLPQPESAAVTDLGDGHKLTTVQPRVAKGDRLLVFSSAVAGQRDPGGQPFGQSRLAASATRAAPRELRAALEAMVADLDAFRAGAPQDGDYVLVGIDV